MRAINPIITMIAIVITMASCSTGIVDDAAPGVANERIDLVIEGAIDNMISLESPEGLIDISKSSDPFVNENEYQLDFQLEGGNSLRVVLYSIAVEYPLSSVNQFSAYPIQVIEDRQIYAIVQYIDDRDNILYSTTTELAPPHIQPNILEITSANENGFAGRLRNVKLYQVHDGLRTNSSDPSLSSPTIEVTGSFKANNL